MAHLKKKYFFEAAKKLTRPSDRHFLIATFLVKYYYHCHKSLSNVGH